ncbi:MAG TPA: alanine dehydrogenase [Firmicutes bacterium]|nr:alanine dehydrogenase [Bacillota bacterium]
MIVGVPKELKDNENRVAITPAGVEEFRRAGHSVIIESGAGEGSGIPDTAFAEAGANLVKDARAVYEAAEMILKVKEPLPQEYSLLHEGQVLFTYLHLAASEELTRALMKSRTVAIAYETVQLDSGALPLLTPMSEIAGRMAVQLGAQYLENIHGGRGILLSGVPGVPPAEVVIIGGGTVGTNAAKIAIGMGAHVTIIEKNADRLRYLDEILHGNVITVMSNSYNIERAVRYADLLIGAVLIPGARAPKLVRESMVKQMKPGSVIVDVAVDQGGCVETADHPTTHSDPIYVKYGVIHYSVANMPGAVARTSTYALTNVTIPYALEIANKGYIRAIKENKALARGVNVVGGKIVHRGVAEAHGLEFYELESVI